MINIEDLGVKIFADGADETSMIEMYSKPYIKGLTTNPTLMRKAGIKDYRNDKRVNFISHLTVPISVPIGLTANTPECLQGVRLILGFTHDHESKLSNFNTTISSEL